MLLSRTLALPALAALAVALGACGGDDGSDSQSAGATGTQSSPSTQTQTQSASSQELLRDTTQKPPVQPPSGPPPSTLRKRDIVVGKGKVARPGDNVTVQYVGVNFSNGAQFDASWDSGKPFTFALGTGAVIPGWDRGVPGMRVGGRRELIIPPDLAYGPQGQPPTIGPDETLVFVIDLKSVRKGG